MKLFTNPPKQFSIISLKDKENYQVNNSLKVGGIKIA